MGQDVMQLPEGFIALLDHANRLIVEGQYVELERLTQGMRLNALEMLTAIAEYGRTLVLPSLSTSKPDIIEIRSSPMPQWSVIMPLSTVDEITSDLSLELTVTETPKGLLELSIDNIHVL